MPPERRVVLLVLGLAVLGQGLRLWVGRPDRPPGDLRLFGAGAARSPGAHRDSGVALAKPLAPGERIDLDRASAAEIARLPRIGPRLARAIATYRETHGPFGGAEALDRVPGVGPGLLASIAGHIRFSTAGLVGRSTSAGPALPVDSGVVPRRAAPAGGPIVNLNRASLAELEALPFVGPYMAQRIVDYRTRHGRFPTVDSLVLVPGIGPATLAKIRERVTVD